MSTQQDLFREVETVVDAMIATGRCVEADWVANAIMAAHADINGGDAAWHTCNSWQNVRSTVRQVVQRYKPKADDGAQLVLPGYEHLRAAYLVTRVKRQVVVPVAQLTDEEIGAVMAELDAMAAGCLAHREELRRYRDERRARASQPAA